MGFFCLHFYLSIPLGHRNGLRQSWKRKGMDEESSFSDIDCGFRKRENPWFKLLNFFLNPDSLLVIIEWSLRAVENMQCLSDVFKYTPCTIIVCYSTCFAVLRIITHCFFEKDPVSLYLICGINILHILNSLYIDIMLYPVYNATSSLANPVHCLGRRFCF